MKSRRIASSAQKLGDDAVVGAWKPGGKTPMMV
jgi:hypothetical protein